MHGAGSGDLEPTVHRGATRRTWSEAYRRPTYWNCRSRSSSGSRLRSHMTKTRSEIVGSLARSPQCPDYEQRNQRWRASVRPTRATTSLAASVDHTEARNAPVPVTAQCSRWRDRTSSPRTAATPRATAGPPKTSLPDRLSAANATDVTKGTASCAEAGPGAFLPSRPLPGHCTGVSRCRWLGQVEPLPLSAGAG
jgi:hypothetical protein